MFTQLKNVCPLHIWAVAIVITGVATSPGNSQDPARNSTAKNRVQPSKIASKAGTAINWVKDFSAAERLSRELGKPIFWYVPTVRGTFMDRKDEIDRYMMAGIFSWPRVINLLNNEFICVKAPPTPDQQKQFELSVYKFVEPGFLVLNDRCEVFKVDRITTQHLEWIVSLLVKQVNGRSDGADVPAVQQLWESFRQNETPQGPELEKLNDELAHQLMIAGMSEFRAGEHDLAKTTWSRLVQQMPDHPLAWKAEAEIQGIGPFVRGFEIHRTLPNQCLQAGIMSQGSRAPAGCYTRPELWARGIEFLLGMQNESGGFLDCDYDFGGTDSLPNVHVAITALVGMALIEANSDSANPSDKVNEAIEKCFAFVTDDDKINRIDRDEILWADAYRLRFLCRYKRRSESNKNADPIIDAAIQSTVTHLQNIQSNRGGWYHEYENPFVTATALCALFEAQRVQAVVDKNKIEKGLKSLAKQRSPDGTFPYASGRKRLTPVAAAAGRMPICELALAKWGRSDQQRLIAAVKHSLQHHQNLDVALKYDDHTSRYGYGGFFFWYDMRSRSEAILAIEDKAIRDSLMAQQLELVLGLPEIDGCFVDSHELGRCYGTAMALMCLKNIASSESQ